MAKPKLVRPIKAIVVGDVDVICKQIGKYFDDFIQVGREKKYKRRDLEGAQIVCFATQACANDLKHEWATYARDNNLPVMSCRRGAEVPTMLDADFEVTTPPKEEAPAEEETPESLVKAQQAEKEAKQMVADAQAAAPTNAKVGIESLDFLANIQKQVQDKLTAAQGQVDEAMGLYLQESEKVKDLEARLTELSNELKQNDEKISTEVAAKLQKAVEKETVKLSTELRRKEKAISDQEKALEKLKEKVDTAELALVDIKAKLASAEERAKMVDMDFDIDKVVMTHHLLMLAHTIVYVKPDNKWLAAIWKVLQGISEDPEIATLISRIRDASEARTSEGKNILIPPMSKADRDKIRTALAVI